jgi:hypothetical protein
VSCQIQKYALLKYQHDRSPHRTTLPPSHFLTSSYDGTIRLFSYSRSPIHTVHAHDAPISSICVVPSQNSSQDDTHLIASGSHDLSAQLTRLIVPSSSESTATSQALATLHLHTEPLSCISSNLAGSHLLSASWDGLVGLWDTTIPTSDEVAAYPNDSGADAGSGRKKRRRVDPAATPTRKAPAGVLKSHTARVSKAVFRADGALAFSCGFDSTVRTWDVESSVCTNTIVSVHPYYYYFRRVCVFLNMMNRLSLRNLSSISCSAQTRTPPWGPRLTAPSRCSTSVRRPPLPQRFYRSNTRRRLRVSHAHHPRRINLPVARMTVLSGYGT